MMQFKILGEKKRKEGRLDVQNCVLQKCGPEVWLDPRDTAIVSFP